MIFIRGNNERLLCRNAHWKLDCFIGKGVKGIVMVGFCIGVIFCWLINLDMRLTELEKRKDDE
jgi:hypothetical protein